MNDILGITTMIAATTMVVIFLPLQIKKHYDEKVVGLHPGIIILSFIVYSCRALFALTNESGIIWYIFVSDAIGTVASTVMIVQVIIYKKQKV